MDIIMRVKEHEGRKYKVFYKTSWNERYCSVDGQLTWVKTGANKVAFAQTARENWKRFDQQSHQQRN